MGAWRTGHDSRSMAGGALLMLLAVGVVSSTFGFEDSSTEEYESMEKAPNFISAPKKCLTPSKDSVGSYFRCSITGEVHRKRGDCDSYIKCINGLPYVLDCQPGQHFSEKTGKCTSPCEAHCDENIACECGWKSCSDTNELPPNYFPEEDPAPVHFQCHMNGRFPNPQSCTEYIECENQIAYYKKCPEGLHFSQRRRRCFHPCKARCDREYVATRCRWRRSLSSGCPESPETVIDSKVSFICNTNGLFSTPSNCTTFIECCRGLPYLLICPAGMHFSPEVKRCEPQCDARCDPSLTEECGWGEDEVTKMPDDYCFIDLSQSDQNVDDLKTEEDDCVGECAVSKTNSMQVSDSTIATPQHKEGYTCIKDGLYPNRDDCNSYIKCSNGSPYVMPCPRGLHFSKRIQKCESPCDAECEPSIADECGWNKKTLKSGPYGMCSLPSKRGPCRRAVKRWHYDSKTGICISFVYGGCKGNENNFKTKADCEAACLTEDYSDLIPFLKEDYICVEDGLYPNQENCNTYIECFDKLPYVKPCPKGLHFSEATEACERVCDARCDPSLADICELSEKSEPQDICRLPADKGVCDSFMQRYFFDWTKGMCRTFFYSGCRGNKNNFRTKEDCENRCLRYSDISSTTLSPGIMPSYDFRCIKDGLYPNPEECSSFIQCSNGLPFIMQCPEGLHFSDKYKRCEYPCTARCDTSIGEKCEWDESSKYPVSSRKEVIEVNCGKDGLFPNPDDCTTYVECSNGLPNLMSCPEGLHFSLETEGCESPCDAHCDTEIAEECGWEDSGKYSYVRQLMRYSGVIIRQKNLRNEINCVKDGLYSNTENCSTYIQCSNGLSYIMPCPPGLHFSEETQRCESPCDARCDLDIAEECGWEESKNENDNIPDIPEEIKSYQCPSPNGNFSSFYNCAIYYECRDGRAFLKLCPERMAFDNLDRRCVPYDEVRCILWCPSNNGHYLYRSDPSKYISCMNGISKVEKCPPGQVFDSKSGVCVYNTI